MELDVESCLTGRYAQGGGDVCFPCACFGEDKQWLVVYNKVEILKVFELFHIEAGLEVPVEGIKAHVLGELGLLHPSVQGSGFDGCELMLDQLGKKLKVALSVCMFECSIQGFCHILEA